MFFINVGSNYFWERYATFNNYRINRNKETGVLRCRLPRLPLGITFYATDTITDALEYFRDIKS